VVKDLDWKRVFAIHLAYSTTREASISDAVTRYEQAFTQYSGPNIPADLRVAQPLSWFLEENSFLKSEVLSSPLSVQQTDVLFHLIKAHVDRTYPLENVLLPCCSVPSLIDYRLSWQLHIMLTYVLQVCDFADRQEDGISVLSTNICLSFAFQLERLGLWEWAVFVLLHIGNVVW
jgi:nuclear pore complex protein Nup98-Nup96